LTKQFLAQYWHIIALLVICFYFFLVDKEIYVVLK